MVPVPGPRSPVASATGPEPGPPSALRGKPDPLPSVLRTYSQLLRGGRARWWKPIVALLLVAVAGGLLSVVVFALVATLGGLVEGVPDLGGYVDRITAADDPSPAGFLALNLSLAALIPAAGLSVWAVHRIRPRYVSSVLGGLRWRWLLRCTLVLLPLFIAFLGRNLLLDPSPPGRPAHGIALLVVVLLTTPLQAVGEEYFFRGFLLQNGGAWFGRPTLALVVPAVLSAALFAAAHGSPDPWVLADLGFFALVATAMVWRTGGLEAGIALHALNNTLLFVAVLGFGGWEESFVDGQTTSTPGAFGVSAGLQLLALALVWWQARRGTIDPRYRSPLPVPAAGPGWPGPAEGSYSSGFVAGHVTTGLFSP